MQPAALSPGTAGDITTSEFLEGWAAFLDHFSEVEDARFKVKVANFDDSAQAIIGADVPTAVPGATGHARVAFFVIGRDRENRREWARGVVEADVRYADNKHWQFQSFELTLGTASIRTSPLTSADYQAAGRGAEVSLILTTMAGAISTPPTASSPASP